MSGKVEEISGTARLNRYVTENIDKLLPVNYNRSKTMSSWTGSFWEIKEVGWFKKPFIQISRSIDEDDPEDKYGKLITIRIYAIEVPEWVDILAVRLANIHGFHVQKIPN